jgi:hypothetical protein
MSVFLEKASSISRKWFLAIVLCIELSIVPELHSRCQNTPDDGSGGCKLNQVVDDFGPAYSEQPSHVALPPSAVMRLTARMLNFEGGD